jgi:hypothetical protein
MSMVILQLGIPSGTGDKENLGSFNCLLLRIFDGTKKQEVSLDVKHIAYPIRPVYDPK